MNVYHYASSDPINLLDPSGQIAIIPIVLGAWVVTELVLSTLDVVDLVNVLRDPCSTGADIGVAVAFTAFGFVGPGSTGGRRGRVVIGETATRVNEYAARIGAEVFPGVSEEAASRGVRSMWRENREWLERVYREGYEIIDIGLDPNRPDRGIFYRAERLLLDRLQGGG